MTKQLVVRVQVPTSTVWSEHWRPGDAFVPDTWLATRLHPSSKDIIAAEIEVSRASFTIGQKALTHCTASVSVSAPDGYAMVQDLARPWPFEWWPMHAAFRRYAFYPASKPELRAEAEAIAAGLYDQAMWRANRLQFGPFELPLPTLNPTQKAVAAQTVSGHLGWLRQLLLTGGIGGVEDAEDGLLCAPVGGFRPWGPKERGRPAGSGIFFWTGWEQAPDLPAYLWLVVACNHERWWHAYDHATGKVITADQYGDPGPKYQSGTGDPNNGWLPEFIGVAQNPDPIYLPYDAGHSIRGLRHLIALSDMVDSPMIRRALKGQAAQQRLQCSEKGPPPGSNYTPPCLRTYLKDAQAAPNTGHGGTDAGRRFGWPAFLIAQSIKHGCAENIPWAKMAVDMANLSAMPNGVWPRAKVDDPKDIWYDPRNDTAHAFEVPIFWAGIMGCAKQVGLPIPTGVVRSAQALYEEAPLWPWYGTSVGPPDYMYVAARGGSPYPSIPGGKTNQSPAGDGTHVETGCAMAAATTGLERYLIDSARVGVPFPDWRTKMHWLDTKTDLRNDAGLIAQYQRWISKTQEGAPSA